MTNTFLFRCNITTVDHVLNTIGMSTLYGSYALLELTDEYLPNNFKCYVHSMNTFLTKA